jgi:multicomponent Na+:H+ antiporter subunit C
MSALIGFGPYVVAVWLFLAGVYGLVTSRNLIHLVICLSVLQSSTYVLLLAIGYRSGGSAPIFYHLPLSTSAVDSVVQALMLTDVVVEATVMALLLSLAVKVHERAGTLEPDKLDRLRG